MSGRPFLQIPRPTLVPERVTRAMSESIIDHRGPKFAALVHECLAGLKGVFQTEKGQIVIYPGSGTGAWEACLVNTLSPGDRLLACVNGHFSTGFARTGAAYGIEADRRGVPCGAGGAGAVRAPQRGLIPPPGLAILAVSDKALHAGEKAKCPRAYWDWAPVLERNRRGEFPYTPATSLLFGLRESLAMLNEEGLPNVFKRHARLAEACRRAVGALGFRLPRPNPP